MEHGVAIYVAQRDDAQTSLYEVINQYFVSGDLYTRLESRLLTIYTQLETTLDVAIAE